VLKDLVAEGVPTSKIRLIPNGIDPETFSRLGLSRGEVRDRLDISHEALVFSVVANLFPYKGHADLLRALQLVGNRLPQRWVLLAPGRDIEGNLDRMRRLSDQLGIADHVRFLGERNDVAAILLAADIHLSTSRTEGFPNNILEAMCAGLPVIATAVGGVPEMVINDVTGLLLPAQNPSEMARAVLQLVNDADQRRSMGEAGRRRAVSLFSIERSVEAFECVYAEFAARR
jgi:glycosyltransferase involved in cell wall biosynthesis